MNISLAGKIALVTGSTSGIGLAIAKGLAAAGAETIVNGRAKDKVDRVVAGLQRAMPEAKLRGIAADVADAAGCEALVRAAPHVDVLINNAGIFEPKDFFAIPDSDWLRFYETNVMSGVRLSRAYMPGMLKRDWGRVVFISSESGLHIPAEMVHYGMTKTAQLAVARGLAETVAGTGVTVNSVLPGPTLSEGVEVFMRQMAAGQSNPDLQQMGRDFIREHRSSSLLGRLATIEEVANMIAYVCTPAASATSGAALRVDGGVVRSIA